MLCPHCGKEIAAYTSQVNTAGQPLYLPNPIANAAAGGDTGIITIVANAEQPYPWMNTMCAGAAAAQPITFIKF